MMENLTEVKKRKYNKRDLVTINTTAGIDEDLEIFIYKVFEQFEKNVGPRFSEFTAQWHKSNFGLIFCDSVDTVIAIPSCFGIVCLA